MDEKVQQRWKMAAPEIAECLEQSGKTLHAKGGKQGKYNLIMRAHHEDNLAQKIKDFCNVSALIASILLSLNSFLEKTFVNTGTNVRFSDHVFELAEFIYNAGQQQYKDFVYPFFLTYNKKNL